MSHTRKGTASQSSPPDSPATPQSGGNPRVWAWVAGGAAAAAIGAGFVFGQQSKSTAEALSSTEHTGAEVQKLESDFRSQALRANILLGVGAGLAALSATSFVLQF